MALLAYSLKTTSATTPKEVSYKKAKIRCLNKCVQQLKLKLVKGFKNWVNVLKRTQKSYLHLELLK